MAKGLQKKVNKRKKKLEAAQNIALDGEKQAEFNEKVELMKNEMKEGKRHIPGDRGSPGVVYVGSIPRGFNERQMKQFFSQFGKVLRLRISRSKKTGNPKGYAFIMFEYDEVAQVVADTMNNYLMFQKLMKCRHVPAEEVHPSLFKGWDRKFTAPKAHLVSMRRHNANKSAEQLKVMASRARRKMQNKIDKLAAMGIDYSIKVGDKTITARKRTGDNSESDSRLNDKSESRLDDDVDESVPTLSTPAKQILLEDSSDDEITMKTPPGSVRVKKAKSKVKGQVVKSKPDVKSKGGPKTIKPRKIVKTNIVKSAKTSGKVGTLGGKVKAKGKKR